MAAYVDPLFALLPPSILYSTLNADLTSSLVAICTPYSLSQMAPTEKTKLYVQAELLVQHLAILRNKQCLLAYLMARARKLQALRWELSSETLPEEVLPFISPQERRFKEDYNEILREYLLDIDLDLTLVRIKSSPQAFGARTSLVELVLQNSPFPPF